MCRTLEFEIIESERQVFDPAACKQSFLSKLKFPVGLSLFEVFLLTRQDNPKYFVVQVLQTDQYSNTFVHIQGKNTLKLSCKQLLGPNDSREKNLTQSFFKIICLFIPIDYKSL